MGVTYDELVIKQRSFLLKVSIAILLFDIAGGKIENEVPLLSGKVTVEDIRVIYAFIFMMYIYSLIRYWLSSKALERDVVSNFTNALYDDLGFKRLLRDYWDKDFFRNWKDPETRLRHPSLNVRPSFIIPFGWNIFFVNFDFSRAKEGHAFAPALVKANETRVVNNVNIGRFRINFIAFKLLVKCIFKNIIYTEFLFPYLIAFLVPVVKWWEIIRVLTSN